MTIPEKISSIVTDVNKGVYDKDCELKLALLCANQRQMYSVTTCLCNLCKACKDLHTKYNSNTFASVI